MSGIGYLENLNKFGVKPGLERTELLLDYLGNPQDELNVIHISGTNGKGSTSAILTSVYKEAGYKVGTYNSPHIIEFNERIRINDVNISTADLESLVREIKPAIDRVAKELEHPTFFEVVTALALLYFYKQEVDLAILEVGLGGKLDATNVVDSLISVITNVSLDHTEYLGDTLEEITLEKAGIIKPGQQVITAAQKKEVISELTKVCQEKRARLVNINKKFKLKEKKTDLAYQIFDIEGKDRNYNELRLPLLGKHQIFNTATAIGVIEALAEEYPVDLVVIKQGISKVKWPGRLEVVASKPTMLLDGAHNQAGAKQLKSALEKLEYKELFLVLSILADKDMEAIIKEVVPEATKVIISQNCNERVASISTLREKVIKYNSNIEIKEELEKALEYVTKIADETDLIIISGSLYTVGEARRILIK